MIIYLDTCCYCRPYDYLIQLNMRMELIAIRSVISICETEGFPIIGSPVLALEISNIRSDEIRRMVKDFYTRTVTQTLPLTAEVRVRAAALQAGGFNVGGLKTQDAYHAALAEAARADYLLTTDVKFEKRAAKLGVKTMVINPINFIQEYSKWLQSLT